MRRCLVARAYSQRPEPPVVRVAATVQCWSDEHWGEPATNSEDVTIVGNVLTLKLGGYIYEVTAEWNTENGYGGTASYFIYLKTAD